MLEFSKLIAVSLFVSSLSASAFAAKEVAHVRPDQEEPPADVMAPKQLKPATRYQGRTPIDLSNGLSWNNGTYGIENPEHEDWATSKSFVPNVSEKPYKFDRKDDFISGLRESERFAQTAISNWDNSIAHPTEVTKPEVLEYAKNSSALMKPILDKFSKAIATADSASESKWDGAENDARKALVELRTTYWQLHHNPR